MKKKTALKKIPNRGPLYAVLAILTVIAGVSIFVLVTSALKKGSLSDQVKNVLHQVHSNQQKLFLETGKYSFDMEQVWNGVDVEGLNPSRFAFGFQRTCALKFSKPAPVTHTIGGPGNEDSNTFGLLYHPDFIEIADGAFVFFDDYEEGMDCLMPEEGFLFYAVGTQGDGELDIWIINHEKTVGHIRPTL